MRRYYTRACNFHYGSESRLLVDSNKSIPLNGNKNISFDHIEIISRISKRKISINKINSLGKSLNKMIKIDLKKIRTKKKGFSNLNFIQIPNIMGVLNLTPDSFSDGGEFNKGNKGLRHALEMFNSGANIIDIGGGDSKLVDYLLMEGFTNITVLDISGKALEKAKLRLGVLAKEVTWIESDILDFKPTQTYDLWHDRAAFHFLTKTEHIQKYLNLSAEFAVNHMILGTFSTDGPLKCSGLEISQYNSHTLSEIMVGFDRISSKTENHTTPFDTIQNFLFCHFKKA